MLDTTDLDTPVPVVDMATMKANIARLQALCDTAGVSNRPHINELNTPGDPVNQCKGDVKIGNTGSFGAVACP